MSGLERSPTPRRRRRPLHVRQGCYSTTEKKGRRRAFEATVTSRAHSPAFTYLPPALYGLGVATHRRTHSGYKPAKNKLTCCDFTSFYHMQVSTNSH